MLIINHGSGEVSTFPVFNDGSTDGKFYAALTDRLQITITDPLGYWYNAEDFDACLYLEEDKDGRLVSWKLGG